MVKIAHHSSHKPSPPSAFQSHKCISRSAVPIFKIHFEGLCDHAVADPCRDGGGGGGTIWQLGPRPTYEVKTLAT